MRREPRGGQLRRGDREGAAASRETLVAVVREAQVQGVSTDAVGAPPEALGMAGISGRQVGPVCEEIDNRLKSFLDALLAAEWPYSWIAATCEKGRPSGLVVSVAVIVVVGADSDGRCEVLDTDIRPSESETIRTAFLPKPSCRDLRDVRLVVPDAHNGSKAAIGQVPHATWRRCHVHFARDAPPRAGKSGRRVASAFVATAFARETAAAAPGAVTQARRPAPAEVPRTRGLLGTTPRPTCRPT